MEKERGKKEREREKNGEKELSVTEILIEVRESNIKKVRRKKRR